MFETADLGSKMTKDEHRRELPQLRVDLINAQYDLRQADFRWESYRLAVNEMVQRTSTDFAPWTLVAAEDKRDARLTVLETICDGLTARLDQNASTR